MILKNQVPITNSEAKDILAKKMKDKELSPEQQAAYDYLKNVAKLSKTDAKKLSDELKEFGLKEEQIVNIVNILPEDEEILKLIIRKEGEATPAKGKDILKIVSNYTT